MTPKDEVLTVVQALRRYTSDNPLACDTPDGIARWWLRGRFAPALVEAGLAQLLELGLLERLPAADGRVRYRLCGAVAAVPAPAPASTGKTS